MTSWWAWWRLKSPASRLFAQPFIQAQIKDNIKAPRHWLCARNSPVTGEFLAQKASNAENVSIWWRHHDMNIFHYRRQGRRVIWKLYDSFCGTYTACGLILRSWHPTLCPADTLCVAVVTVAYSQCCNFVSLHYWVFVKFQSDRKTLLPAIMYLFISLVCHISQTWPPFFKKNINLFKKNTITPRDLE